LLFALGMVSAQRTARAEPSPLERYGAVSPDSSDARRAVISGDLKAFRIDFDAALAKAARNDARWGILFPQAAADYWKATGDSLLIADLEFTRKANATVRNRWFEATGWDESASALQSTDPAKSSGLFRRAAERYRDIRHLRREAVAWGSLGVACWNAGDLDCVLDAYRRALVTRRQLGDSLLIGRTLNGLGSVHFKRGDYDSALVYYREAKAVRERLGRPADLGTTLAYIGNVYYRLGNLKEARAHYEAALDQLGENGPKSPVSEARIGLANVWSDLGDNREAARIYGEEIAAALARGDTLWAARIRGNLGLVTFRLGQHAEAIQELQAAKGALTRADDRYELSTILNRMGLVYQDLSDYSRALSAFQESNRLAVESENRQVQGNSLVNMGLTYYRMHVLDRAQSSYDQALEVYGALADSVEMNEVKGMIALVKIEKGQLEDALALYQGVLAFDAARGLQTSMAYAHGNIAVVLDRLGRSEEARHEFARGADLARDLRRNDILWPCWLGIGQTFERSGGLDSARVYNNQAIDVLEMQRGGSFSDETKAAFLGQWSYVYEDQIRVLAELYQRDGARSHIEEALQISERGKARAFLDALAEGNVDVDQSLDPETRHRIKELEVAQNEIRHRLRGADAGVPADTLAAWKKDLRELEKSFADLDEQSRLRNPHYAKLGTNRPLSLTEIRRRLLHDDGALLLEYSLGDSGSYLFAVTNREAKLFALPRRSDIETEVRRIRSVLSSPAAAGDAQFMDSATRLYGMVLSPGRDLLAKSSSVIIVPDGLLHLLPFDVLFEKAPAAGGTKDRDALFAKLPYTLATRRVCYGPSASVLALMASAKSEESKGRRLLAVGDPVFRAAGAAPDSSALSPLPESRTEVQSIASRFSPKDRDVLLGMDAREKTITQPDFLEKYRIIHFATHGLVDQRHPERSSLALAYPQDPDEDGYLQASEIYRLHMNADLVVLSACETGLGRMVRGEGVLGLPRAFFYAGAKSVLVSLWSVSDRSTAQLMTSFYTSLINKGEPTSRALTSAKAMLRKKESTAHPFYWAPFVLIGPPETETGRAENNRSH